MAFLKAAKSLLKSLPLILSTVMAVALLTVVIPDSFYRRLFNGHVLWDSLIGDLIGSLSAGNPVTSYILGGEFLKQGVSLAAVTAFIVAWVTVGLIQLPAESAILGKRFALFRNLTAFILAALAGGLTVIILSLNLF